MTYLIETTMGEMGNSIHIFSRDKEGNKKIEVINNFRPYFFVPEEYNVEKYSDTLKVEKGHVTILGDKVKKVFVKDTKKMYYFKQKVKESVPTFESDIPITNRYIIDEIGEVDIYPLNTAYIDIELGVNPEDSFPEMTNPIYPISVISFIDDFSNKTYSFFYKHHSITKEIEEMEGLSVYDSEEDMLNGFLSKIREIDPDILSGWNSTKFDLPYIVNRMNMLGVNASLLSPLNSVYYNESREHVKIKGRIDFDMMAAYMEFRKLTNQGRAESYSLDFTGQEVCGVGKLEHDKNFMRLWIDTPNQCIKYNRKDAELVKNIDDELQIIDFFNSIRAKSCSQLADIYRTTTLIDGLLLRKLHNDVVLPDKNYVQDSEKFSGAFVYPPIPGLYKNVVGLDVKSLYPNLIKTFNISFETACREGPIKIDEGLCFTKEQGIIPKIMIELNEEREKYKRLLKKARKDGNKRLALIYHFRQYAVKVLLNSHFGYLGYQGSRLYRKEVANAITTMGRRVIAFSRIQVEEFGYEVIYMDTDSVAKDSNIIVYDKEGNKGEMSIEELFYSGKNFEHDRKQIVESDYNTPYYDLKTNEVKIAPIKRIIRHNVTKKKYTIKTKSRTVVITEDHSLFVKRDGNVIEIKPCELKKTDKLIKIESFK